MKIDINHGFVCHDCGTNCDVFNCDIFYDDDLFENIDLCKDCISTREEGCDDNTDLDDELESSDFRIKSLKENGV